MKKVLIVIFTVSITLLAIACNFEENVTDAVNPFVKSGDSKLMIDGMNTLPWKDNDAYGVMSNWYRKDGDTYLMKETYLNDFSSLIGELFGSYINFLSSSSDSFFVISSENSLQINNPADYCDYSERELIINNGALTCNYKKNGVSSSTNTNIISETKTLNELIGSEQVFEDLLYQASADELITKQLVADGFNVVALSSGSDTVLVVMADLDLTIESKGKSTTTTNSNSGYICLGLSNDVSLVKEKASIAFEKCEKKVFIQFDGDFQYSDQIISGQQINFVRTYTGKELRCAAEINGASYGLVIKGNSSDSCSVKHNNNYDDLTFDGTVLFGIRNNDSRKPFSFGINVTANTNTSSSEFTYIPNCYINEKRLTGPSIKNDNESVLSVLGYSICYCAMDLISSLFSYL